MQFPVGVDATDAGERPALADIAWIVARFASCIDEETT